MPTLESLRNRIDTARDVQSVVGAMKVLAIVSIRQFEQSLASMSEAGRAVELGLQAALMNTPRDVALAQASAPGGRLCALIFGSEQGLSGQFNEQIAEFALARLDEMGTEASEQTVLAMGEHVGYRLRSAGVLVTRMFALPGSMAAAGRVVQDVFIHLGKLRHDPGFDQVVLFYHKPRTGASYRPFMLRLFPPDPAWLEDLATRPWPSRSLPDITGSWRKLLSALIREYLLLSLERAFAESLLSENASRLMAMQVAEKNIGDYLEDLKHQFNNQRQSEITSELLDIVAGSEALSGEGWEEVSFAQEGQGR